MQARRNQYLREMGIDVWVRRELVRTPEALDANTVDAEPAPAETGPVESRSARTAARSMSAGEPPEFHLCFATYGDLSLIFSLPPEATSLPESMRRFSDDIARAAGITSPPSVAAVRWPMVKARHIDQSEDAARTVVRQRLDGCGPVKLAFGDDVLTWLGENPGCTPVADIARYFAEPAMKRELWQDLKRALAGA